MAKKDGTRSALGWGVFAESNKPTDGVRLPPRTTNWLRPRSLVVVAVVFFACGPQHSTPAEDVTAPPARYDTVVPIPAVLEGIVVNEPSPGAPRGFVVCGTCHGEDVRDNPPLPDSADGLEAPHEGLEFAHGDIRCASCHTEGDRMSLHLADGTNLPMTDAMRLCRQCHGPQSRDYDHGSHGGMRGYWDLSQGPRERNHCVACHDPHAPDFGQFLPMPASRDRFVPDAHAQPHAEPETSDE